MAREALGRPCPQPQVLLFQYLPFAKQVGPDRPRREHPESRRHLHSLLENSKDKDEKEHALPIQATATADEAREGQAPAIAGRHGGNEVGARAVDPR